MMYVTINPKNEKLKELVKKHGESGWHILRNDPKCCQRGGNRASLVCKNNTLIWLIDEEIK